MHDFPPWQQGVRRSYPPFRGNAQADVCIIGGGLAGLTCAYMLTRQGVRVRLLEAGLLGQGASWGCTGKLTMQLGSVYRIIADTVGPDAASAYARLVQDAVHGVQETVLREGIRCSLTPTDVYMFARRKDRLPQLEALLRCQQRLGLPVTHPLDAGGCPFPVAGTIAAAHQAMLSPMPYLLGLAESAAHAGALLHEHSRVVRVSGRRVMTDSGVAEADYVLICTGYPLNLKHLPTQAMLSQHACRLQLLRGDAPLHNCHLDVNTAGPTLRPVTEGLLLALDTGLTGSRQSLQYTFPTEKWLPDWRVTATYHRQDVWSADGLPLIGPISPAEPHLLTVTGMSGWGLVNSHIAARIITGYVTGHPHREALLFLPGCRYAGKLGVLLQGSLPPAAAYLGGFLHPGAPVCPHMGCRMRYSAEREQWECPCHGSVFGVLGTNIDAPAIEPAQVSARQRI